MEFYTDIAAARPLIEECIQKFGHVAEHNLEYFIHWGVDYDARIFVRFPDGSGLLTFRDGNKWEVFVEPLSTREKKIPMLFAFFEHAFSQTEVKKVKVELRTETRRQLLQSLPPHLRASRINYTLTAPVYDLGLFDPALPGGRYKDLRNARNVFYRDHAVEIVDAHTADKHALHAVVNAWEKNRPPRDRAFPNMFHAFIDDDFRGTSSARVFRVDGRVVGLNAGWRIPNSQAYYTAIGLHDYSVRDMGDMLSLEDLDFLKKAGYHYADFGGSWKSAIAYKLKYGEPELYKSFIFSVARK